MAWVAEQAESGLSVQRFCEEKHLSVHSFYSWRQKAAAKPQSDQATFVAVSVLGGVKPVEIELACGAVIRLPRDEATLRQVLGVLVELGDKR